MTSFQREERKEEAEAALIRRKGEMEGKFDHDVRRKQQGRRGFKGFR